MKVHAIKIVVDSMSPKENFGSTIVFRNNCHLAKNLTLEETKLPIFSIKTNCLLQTYIQTSSQNLELWLDRGADPLQLTCLEKIIGGKKVI